MAVPQSTPYEASPPPTSLSLGFGAVRPRSLQAGEIPLRNSSTSAITVRIDSEELGNVGSLEDLLRDHSVEFGVVDFEGWRAGKAIAPSPPGDVSETLVVYARPQAGTGALTGNFRLVAQPGGGDPFVTLVSLSASEDASPLVARVAFVLDRSGSMNSDSGLGDGSTRLDALKPAVKAAVELLGPADEIALVSFATNPTTADFDSNSPAVHNEVQLAEAAFEAQVDALTAGGATGIGRALAAGLAAIPPGSGVGRGLVVFSDGIHNTGPHPSEIALDGTPVYSIGLGPDSDPTLAGLALDTSHMHQVTDLLSGDEGLYRLDKFFAQAILDIVGQQPVIDPVARVRPGERFEVRVPITGLDSLARFVAFARFPRLLSVDLKAPSGELIGVDQAAKWPAVEREVGDRIHAYAVDLARVSKQVKQVVGDWRMIVSISDQQFHELLSALRREPKTYADYKQAGVPVAVHAYARSALRFAFEAAPVPIGLPAKIFLRAEVSAGGLGLAGSKLELLVRSPDRSKPWKLEPKRVGDGSWLVELGAKWSGVYEFMAVAHGEALDGARFRRERLLTVPVRASEPVGPAPFEDPVDEPGHEGGGDGQGCAKLCEQVLALLRDRRAVGLLDKIGYDVEALAAAAKQGCGARPKQPGVLGPKIDRRLSSSINRSSLAGRLAGLLDED